MEQSTLSKEALVGWDAAIVSLEEVVDTSIADSPYVQSMVWAIERLKNMRPKET
jgi:hypothetical protein